MTVCNLNRVDCNALRQLVDSCVEDITNCIDVGQLDLLKTIKEKACQIVLPPGQEETGDETQG